MPISSLINKPLLAQTLIGRTNHKETLAQLVEAAAHGQGHSVLLSGEAGIGKSRLVAETKTLAQQQGFTVVQGNCYEPDSTFPYAPWLDLLQNFCTGQADDALVEAFGPPLVELARLRPQLQPLLPPQETVRPLADPESDKRKLFTALLAFLVHLSASAPLLIIIEDGHWGDDTSLEFIPLLARQINHHPILLLLTFRPDELTPGLRHCLAELDRGRVSIELVLTRFDPGETQAMIATIFAQEKPVQTEFVAAIHQLTDGNPFFIEETLKVLVTSGGIFPAFGGWTRKPIDELQIPRSVEDTVQRRTQRLSEPARTLLNLAAVAGRRFDFNLLHALTGYTETELALLLKELMAAQLVSEETSDRFAFRHALTRQAVYNQLLRRERRTQHDTIAQTLAQMAGAGEDVPLTDLAYHFFAAERWDKAITYARLAGEQAQKLFAPHAAAEQFTRALTAYQKARQEPPPDLYHARAQAYDRLGEFDQARTDYEQAQLIARRHQDHQSEWQALLELGFLWTGQDYHQAGRHLESALRLARQMEQPALLGQTLNRVGNWHLMTEHHTLSIPYHQEALAIFRTLADKRGMATSLDLLGITHFMHGDMVSGAGYYEEAIALWRELGERQWLVSTLSSYATRGGSCLFASTVAPVVPLAQCKQEAEEAIRLAQEIGWPNGEGSALLWYGILLAPRGAFQEALSVRQAALARAEDIKHNLWIETAHALLGVTYAELGQLPLALTHLQEALHRGRDAGSIYVAQSMAGLLARVQIALGQLDTAQTTLDALSDAQTPCLNQAQHHIWRARAELALARQTPSLALPIADRLIASLPGAGQPVVPVLWLLRGEVLLAMERTKEAERVLAAAADAAAQQEHLPILWRTYAALARLYHSRQQLKARDQVISQAQQVVATLTQPLTDATLADSLRQMVHNHLPQSTKRRTATSGGLTRREHEVATLLAQGQSNALIAITLVLSERTIEKHVENIMNKLGFDSRVQIAAWIVSQQ